MQTWSARYAAAEPGDSLWDRQRRRQIFVSRLQQLPTGDVRLSEDEWSRFAFHTSWTIREIVWELRGDQAFHRTVLGLVPGMLGLLAAQTTSEIYGLQYFWQEVVVPARLLDVDALPGIAIEREVRSQATCDLIFETLSAQLVLADSRVQMSALYGFSLLGDPRTRELIAGVRPALTDERVRETAGTLFG